MIGKNWINNFIPERIRKSIWGILDKVEDKKTNENLILTKDGEERMIEWHNANILDENGNIIGTLSSGNDITDRKKMEEELLHSLEREQQLADIVRTSPVAIAYGYPDGRLDKCNKAFSDLTGYSEDELKSINWNKVLTPPKWNEPEAMELSKLTPENNFVRYEKEYLRKDGIIIPIELVVTAKFDEKNKLIHYIGFITDITERKQAERNLKKSKEMLLEAQALAKLGNWSINLNTGEATGSVETKRIYGMPEKESISTAATQKSHLAEYRERLDNSLTDLIRLGKPYDEEFKLKQADSGEIIDVHSIAKYDKEKNIVTGIIQDITESKKAQQALKESEEKFRALYDNAPLSYQSLNEDGTFRDINPTWMNTLGYKRNEVIGKSFADFLHPDWKPHFEKNFPAFKKRGYVSGVEFRIRHKNGNYLDISFEGCIGYNSDGSFRQTYCVFKDITKQKQAELALKESEERYHTLFQNTEEGIIIVNSENFKFEYVNPAICKILGYDYAEMLQLSVPDIHPEDTVEFAEEQFQQLVVNEVRRVADIPFERKDGSVIYMDFNASIINIKGKAKLAVFFTDITDRKLAAEELVRHRVHLEELVRERTKELEAKNAELERFNSLFVGREFRIKELRDKVKKLETQLNMGE